MFLEDLHKEIAELRADPPHYVAGTRNITKLSAKEPPIIKVMQRTRFVLGLVTPVALHRHNMKMTGVWSRLRPTGERHWRAQESWQN